MIVCINIFFHVLVKSSVVFAMASHGWDGAAIAEDMDQHVTVIWRPGAKFGHHNSDKSAEKLFSLALKQHPHRIILFQDIIANSFGLASHQIGNPIHERSVRTEEEVSIALKLMASRCEVEGVLFSVTTGSRMCDCGINHRQWCARTAAKKATSVVQGCGVPFHAGHRIVGTRTSFKINNDVHLTRDALKQCMVAALYGDAPNKRGGKKSAARRLSDLKSK